MKSALKMKPPHPQTRQTPPARGMTLLELTLVILALFALIAVTFIGVNGWKKGANRASCIMNIRNVQVAVRGYSNINSFEPGQSLSGIVLKDEIIGADKALTSDPDCPAFGSYTFGGNAIPTIGTLYMSCSLASSDEHVPPDTDGW